MPLWFTPCYSKHLVHPSTLRRWQPAGWKMSGLFVSTQSSTVAAGMWALCERHDDFAARGACGSGLRLRWRGAEDSCGDKQTTSSSSLSRCHRDESLHGGSSSSRPTRACQAHKKSLPIPQEISTVNQNRVFCTQQPRCQTPRVVHHHWEARYVKYSLQQNCLNNSWLIFLCLEMYLTHIIIPWSDFNKMFS